MEGGDKKIGVEKKVPLKWDSGGPQSGTGVFSESHSGIFGITLGGLQDDTRVVPKMSECVSSKIEAINFVPIIMYAIN